MTGAHRPPVDPVLVLHGRLDVTTVTAVRVLLHAVVDRGDGDVVVDVSRVDVLDATGLALLVAAHERAARVGRRLVLGGVPPRIVRLLAVTRLDRVLTTAPLRAA